MLAIGLISHRVSLPCADRIGDVGWRLRGGERRPPSMHAPVPPRELSLSLDATPQAGVRARQALRSAYAKRLPPIVLSDLLSVVTELVNNSVEHGPGRPITLLVVVTEDVVRGEVKDCGSPKRSLPAIHRASLRGSGRGLRIVDTMTSEWAVLAGSTTVWFEMPATAA